MKENVSNLPETNTEKLVHLVVTNIGSIRLFYTDGGTLAVF